MAGEWPEYQHERSFLTDEQVSVVWSAIKNDPFWWTTLFPLVSSSVFQRINAINRMCSLFFVTHREHNVTPPAVQTSDWLQNYGVDNAAVVVAKYKGEVAKAMSLDYFLEDKLENAWCVHWITGEKCKSYLLNRRYNMVQDFPRVGSRSITRVNSVDEFLDVIAADLDRRWSTE